MALGSGGGGSAKGIRAGGAWVELSVGGSFSKQLADAEKKFNAVGKRLMKTGGLLFGAGIAAGTPLIAGALGSLDELGKLDATAKAFGLTTEAATGLFGVMKAAGSDTRDATEGLVTLGQRVTEAMTGAGVVADEMFKGLGQNAKDYAGLNPAEQFYKLHAALLAVQDPAKRVQLLFNAVGEDTGKNLIGTLSMTTDQLRAQAAGFATSAEDMQQATKANIAYKTALAGISTAWTQIVVGVAPAITFLSDGINKILTPTIAWLKENREIVTVFIGGAAAIAATGAAIFALGSAFSAVGAVIAAAGTIVATFKAAIAALFSPVGLIIAGVTALGYVFFTQTALGQRWAESIGGYFKETLGTVLTAWGGIKNALRGGDFGLAFKIGTAALDVEWKRFLILFQQGWTGAQGFFEDAWTDTIAFLKTTWLGIGDGSLFNDLWSGIVRGAATVGATIKATFFQVIDDIRRFFLKTFQDEIAIGLDIKDGNFGGAFAKIQREIAGINANANKPREDLLEAVKKADAEFQAVNDALAKDILTPDANGLKGKDKINAEAAAEKEANRIRRQATVDEARAALQAAKDRLAAFNAQAGALGGGGDAAGLPPGMQAKLDQIRSAAGSMGFFNLGGFASRAVGDRSVDPMLKQMKELQEGNKIAKKTLEVLEVIKGKASPLVFGG